ncbi:MAG: hypothetical protein IJ705_00055 [Oscillospiraceae bacterium]|nr:hypothetical protein [Oscillospiraceae bacterium]
MEDKERRAHDLAVAFTRDLHADMSRTLDENTLDYLLQTFQNDYESAFDYFKVHLS